eukprot:SM000045S16222  [mRNA]  locus=s45:289858:290511:+ [translate_table: standard]
MRKTCASEPAALKPGHLRWLTRPPIDGLPGQPLEEIQPAAAESPVVINRQSRECTTSRVVGVLTLLATGRQADCVLPAVDADLVGLAVADAVGGHHIRDDAGAACGRDGDQVGAPGMELPVRAQLDGHDASASDGHSVARLQERSMHARPSGGRGTAGKRRSSRPSVLSTVSVISRAAALPCQRQQGGRFTWRRDRAPAKRPPRGRDGGLADGGARR